MKSSFKCVLPFNLAIVVILILGLGSTGAQLANLDESCYQCLCHVATECKLDNGCQGGYCGPFNISRVYWADAGKIVLSDDDPDRNNAWSDCLRDYNCAKDVTKEYLLKSAQDCNGDGVTDCYDYMMVNVNGRYGCQKPLNSSPSGRLALERYKQCSLP